MPAKLDPGSKVPRLAPPSALGPCQIPVQPGPPVRLSNKSMLPPVEHSSSEYPIPGLVAIPLVIVNAVVSSQPMLELTTAL